MKLVIKLRTGIVIALFLSATACLFFIIRNSSYKPAFKGTDLRTYKPGENTGFNKEKLDSLTRFIKDYTATTGMVVLYDGKVIYKYGDIEEVSYIASCRKSVLSILYGKYVANGTIDLNQDIGGIGIEEDDGLLVQEKQATVNDVITSRSGVFHAAANGGYDSDHILARGSVNPGEYFVYNNWDFNVAGAILEKTTGRSVYQEIEDQLAKPLGFQDWNIKNQKRKADTKNSRYSAYHIYLSTRDMAKIGQLMLNEGKWKDKQIVSKEWIKKITSSVTAADTVNARYGRTASSPFQASYGYMWWIINRLEGKDCEGCYSANGFGGQFISVFPKQKIVIAFKNKLGLLTLWGLAPGGTSDETYWKIVDKVLSVKNEQ
jgi:CubicO group peptidase (beta-lactamase class C family)